MPLSKKRLHHIHLRLLTAERAKCRRETITNNTQPKISTALQLWGEKSIDSECESETETDSEFDDEEARVEEEDVNM